MKSKALAVSKQCSTERNVKAQQIEEDTCTEQQDKHKIKMNSKSHNVSNQSSTEGNESPEEMEGDYHTEERKNHVHNEIQLVERDPGEENKRTRRSLNRTDDFAIHENQNNNLVERDPGEENKRTRRSLNRTDDFTIHENQNNNRSRRTSDRISSMPPGYFQTKPAAYFYILPEESKKRKSSSQGGSNRKKKTTHNKSRPEPVDTDDEEVSVVQPKKRILSSPEPQPDPVDTDDEEVSVVQPKKRILSSPDHKISNKKNKVCANDPPRKEDKSGSLLTKKAPLVVEDKGHKKKRHSKETTVKSHRSLPDLSHLIKSSDDHKINTKKNKLPAKIPSHKEGKSGLLVTSENYSDDEKAPLAVEGKGHVKKRVSKKISVKSRQSLPVLSPSNKSSGDEDTRRKSTRLSSHPAHFFKTKPEAVYYIYPSDDSEEEAAEQHMKRLSSSKATRKLYSGN